MIDEEQLKDIMRNGQNKSLLDCLREAYIFGQESSEPKIGSKVQIIIAPRGWVFIGYTHRDGEYLVIEKANVIRVWGTTKGLGELINGPTEDTKLDPCGVTKIPFAAIIAEISCEESKWETKI